MNKRFCLQLMGSHSSYLLKFLFHSVTNSPSACLFSSFGHTLLTQVAVLLPAPSLLALDWRDLFSVASAWPVLWDLHPPQVLTVWEHQGLSSLFSQFSGDGQCLAWWVSGVGRIGQKRPVAPIAPCGR